MESKLANLVQKNSGSGISQPAGLGGMIASAFSEHLIIFQHYCAYLLGTELLHCKNSH